MGDLGDDFRARRKFFKEKRADRLAKADSTGWNVHTEYHWSRQLCGKRLDYWPSKSKFMYNSKVMTGNVNKFIASREAKEARTQQTSKKLTMLEEYDILMQQELSKL